MKTARQTKKVDRHNGRHNARYKDIHKGETKTETKIETKVDTNVDATVNTKVKFVHGEHNIAFLDRVCISVFVKYVKITLCMSEYLLYAKIPNTTFLLKML